MGPPSEVHQVRFIEALSRHQPALEAFCHAHLARREESREALQNASLTLWEKAADWNPETEFLPWAFTVTRFTILALVRDKMRDRLVFDEDVVLAMAAETEAAASEFDERREALRGCLAKLKPEHREVVHAHYIGGRTLKEIAGALRRSESAIKMTMVRLRQQLSQCIQRQLRQAAV
jgi:RNA polymerase sigma-70 factor (ECF subfamily)